METTHVKEVIISSPNSFYFLLRHTANQNQQTPLKLVSDTKLSPDEWIMDENDIYNF